VFDNATRRLSSADADIDRRRIGPEDERIALRCSRKELQALDSFVMNGEFRSRSELMRAALREFLRARAMSTVATPPTADAAGLIEVPVRLRAEEAETLSTYGALVGNGRSLSDVVAELVRRGEMELKVAELVQRHRASTHQAAESRAQLGALQRSGKDLEDKGVVGR
jgi:Arc/MetJ-type ribon-helix-helix transcriptional regulator